jgi:hypothetical protein
LRAVGRDDLIFPPAFAERRIAMLKRLAVPLLMLAVLHVGLAMGQQPQQYPVLDKIADRIIQKYASTPCEQLAQMKSEKPSGEKAEMEQRAMQMLKNDPQMRQYFLNKVAGPIANKMFECGMIP